MGRSGGAGADGMTATLVVGGGGLLGGALVRLQRAGGGQALVPVVDWGGAPEADLAAAVDRFAMLVAGGPWRVVWCAGSGVTGSGEGALTQENGVLSSFLQMLRTRLGPSLAAQRGSFFLASSVGGVYGGAEAPPYTEATVPRPLSGYGVAKVRAESLVTAWCARSGVRGLIGRITNLYGPGQNLAKPQGLVSHLCRAHVTGAPVGIYVPLDTIRDYVFAPDCARLIVDALTRVEDVVSPGEVVVKILASHRPLSVAALIKESQRVFRRPLRLLYAPSVSSAGQARDLRVASAVWPDLDRRPLETLAAGIATTADDVESRMRRGGFSPRRV